MIIKMLLPIIIQISLPLWVVLGNSDNTITPESFQKRSASRAPSLTELKKVDDLLNQNDYEEAGRELARLQKKYRASSEVYYRAIKALALEVKWATTLQGQERVQVMNRLMYSEDYLGLICASSKAYLDLFASSDKHFKTVRALHDIAKTSLNRAQCKQRPRRELVTEEFVSRLEPFANFIKKLEALTFE